MIFSIRAVLNRPQSWFCVLALYEVGHGKIPVPNTSKKPKGSETIILLDLCWMCSSACICCLEVSLIQSKLWFKKQMKWVESDLRGNVKQYLSTSGKSLLSPVRFSKKWPGEGDRKNVLVSWFREPESKISYVCMWKISFGFDLGFDSIFLKLGRTAVSMKSWSCLLDQINPRGGGGHANSRNFGKWKTWLSILLKLNKLIICYEK